MKWIHTGWLLAIMLAASSPALQAADVTITVNGKVVAKPCTVSPLTPPSIWAISYLQPGISRLRIGLAQHRARFKQLPGRHLAGHRQLQRYGGRHRLLQNQGTAGNIQLELQDEGGNTLNTGATKTVQVDDSTQSARFPLQVRALTVNGGATQGTIQAVINVTYTYA
jgi:minor fimbrial subunit